MTKASTYRKLQEEAKTQGRIKARISAWWQAERSCRLPEINFAVLDFSQLIQAEEEDPQTVKAH